jgi:hypothetical protein
MGEGENGGPARRVEEEEGVGAGSRQDVWPVEAGGCTLGGSEGEK